MNAVIETIDPTTAERYLASNKSNRKLRQNYSRRLARQMAAGDWTLSHQAIAFNGDGSLRDGQHRLHAIVLSKTTQQFLVARGVSEDSIFHCDTHAMRGDADAFRIAGHDITKEHVAVAKSMIAVLGMSNLTHRKMLLRFIQKYVEGIRFSLESIPVRRKGISHSCVRAVIAMAFYSVDRERLEEFDRSLYSGVVASSETDTAVLRLRDWLLSTELTSGGSSARKVISQKAAAALNAFLQYRPLSKLYARTEYYTLPGVEEFDCDPLQQSDKE